MSGGSTQNSKLKTRREDPMKCPKCGYLGFETGDRCRNCGYDFSLAAGTFDLPEVSLTGDSAQPLSDFGLQAPDSRPETDSGLRTSDVGRPAPDPGPRTPDPGQPESDDLPLLPGFDAPDLKLVKASRQPRAPLAVRRSTPEFPRFRSELRTPQSIDLSFAPEPDEPKAAEPPIARSAPAARAAGGASAASTSGVPAEPASAAHRLLAAVIDLTLLAALDLLVLYFTLRICGLTMGQLGILPIVPLVGFFVVLNGGYLAAFTAGGQTIGKMALGIRIVGAEEPLSAGRAIVRTVFWVAAAVPAGLGFLSIFINAEHRGLHDRFARTRVILAR